MPSTAGEETVVWRKQAAQEHIIREAQVKFLTEGCLIPYPLLLTTILYFTQIIVEFNLLNYYSVLRGDVLDSSQSLNKQSM